VLVTLSRKAGRAECLVVRICSVADDGVEYMIIADEGRGGTYGAIVTTG